jgi:hypothetical protein
VTTPHYIPEDFKLHNELEFVAYVLQNVGNDPLEVRTQAEGNRNLKVK